MELKTALSGGSTPYGNHDGTGRAIVCVEELVSGLKSWPGALDSAVQGCEQVMMLDAVAAPLRRAHNSDPSMRWMRPGQVCGRTLEWMESDRDIKLPPPTKLRDYSFGIRSSNAAKLANAARVAALPGLTSAGVRPAQRAPPASGRRGRCGFWGSPYSIKVAASSAAPVVVGNYATTVLVLDLLRAVTVFIMILGELEREEKLRVEAMLNYFLHAFHTQNDELAAANVSCAQIDFLRGSHTAQEERVRMADAEAGPGENAAIS